MSPERHAALVSLFLENQTLALETFRRTPLFMIAMPKPISLASAHDHSLRNDVVYFIHEVATMPELDGSRHCRVTCEDVFITDLPPIRRRRR